MVVDDDPHSLPAHQFHFANGLVVEVKTSHLGVHAPWKACQTCPVRKQCREGTYAMRMMTDGTVQPCMDRPDLAFDLASHAERGVPAMADALQAWLTEVVA